MIAPDFTAAPVTRFTHELQADIDQTVADLDRLEPLPSLASLTGRISQATTAAVIDPGKRGDLIEATNDLAEGKGKRKHEQHNALTIKLKSLKQEPSSSASKHWPGTSHPTSANSWTIC